MAVKVGTVVLSLKADTAKLVKGMNQAQRATQKAVQGMKRTVATLAGLFVGGQLLSSLKNVSNELDKIGKVSAKLGVTAEELQKLQYIADLSGVSIQSLNTGLQRMARRVSEASAGTGEAQKALKELGLEAKDLNRLSPDKQMLEIAEAMKKITNQNDRLRLAIKIFDTEGAGFVNFLKLGKDGLKAMGLEAEQLGAIISSDMIAKVEASNDAMTKMGTITDKVMSGIRIGFSEAMIQAFESTKDFNSELVNVDSIAKGVSKSIIVLTGYFKIFTDTIKLSMAGYELLVAVFDSKTKDLVNGTSEAINKASNNAKKALKELQMSNNQVFEDLKKFDSIRSSIGGVSVTLDDLEEVQKEIEEYKKQVIKTQKQVANSFTLPKEELKKTTEEAKKLNNEFNLTDIAMNSLGKNIKLKEELKEIREITDNISNSLENNMMNAFSDIMDGAFSFKDTMKNILKDIALEFIRTQVVQQSVSAISGGIGSAISGGFGGFFAKGGVFSGGNVQAFAKGGVVDSPTNFGMSGGRTGLMGEAGPEAIIPLKRGSNGELGVGATPVNIQVINNASNSEARVEQDGENYKVIIDMAERSIANNISRGTGPMGDAISGMKKQGRL